MVAKKTSLNFTKLPWLLAVEYWGLKAPIQNISGPKYKHIKY